MIHALMPSIHERQTGGSIFNRRVLGRLAARGAVEVVIEATGGMASARPLEVVLGAAGGKERSSESASLEVVFEAAGGKDDGVQERLAAAPRVWLVDSLCLDGGAALLEACPDSAGVLIAHYLELLDPLRCGSARAEAEKRALARYRGVVTTSRFAADTLRGRSYRGEVFAALPGLDDAYRRQVRRHDSRATTAILTVANVVPNKGLLEMLDCLMALSDLDWTWEIIGDAELDAGFAAQFRERTAGCDRIAIRGALPAEEVLAAYDRSDLFALPSRFETCSMATMEAMARGLAVAAFRVGGLPDLLPEVSRAGLVEWGDLAGFRGWLSKLLMDRERRQELGAANRAASAAFPNWEECGDAVAGFLNRF